MATKTATKAAAKPVKADLMEESTSPPLIDASGVKNETALVATSDPSAMVMDRARTELDLGDEWNAQHVGGALPLINFKRPGQSFVGLFVRRDPANEERAFPMLAFDMIDPRQLRATRDPLKSIVGRAQLIGSYAVDEFFVAPNREGKVYRLTYVGETATKKGLNNLKLITVEELARK